MTNLTIALDASIVRKARVRAIGEDTSISAKVREFLAQYANFETAPVPAKKLSKPIELPVFRGGGGKGGMLPGIDPTSNKSMYDAADQE